MDDNNVVEKPKSGYNEPTDEVVERINLKNLKPINDTTCKHEQMIPDPTDETEDYIAYKCANPDCHRGFLVSKHE